MPTFSKVHLDAEESYAGGPLWTDMVIFGGFGLFLYNAPHMAEKATRLLRQVPPIISNVWGRAATAPYVQALRQLNHRRQRGSFVRLLAELVPLRFFGPTGRIYIPQIHFKSDETVFAFGEKEDPQYGGVIIAYANNTASTDCVEIETEMCYEERVEWDTLTVTNESSPIISSYTHNLCSTPNGPNRKPLRSHLFETTTSNEEIEEMKRTIDILQAHVQLLLKKSDLNLHGNYLPSVPVPPIMEEKIPITSTATLPPLPPPLPPPPPPPPPPMANNVLANSAVLKLKTKNPGDSLDQANDAKKNVDPKVPTMSDVLKNIGTVKLRPVNLERSPNGTPLKRRPLECSRNDHQSLIADALKKRFACIQTLDDSDSFADKENTGGDTDDSFNSSIPGLKLTARRSFPKTRSSIEKNKMPIFGQHLLKKRMPEIEKRETDQHNHQPLRVHN